jgi:hypothetical protein
MRGEGQLIPNPRAEEVIQADDVLIIMGTPKQLAEAAIMFAPAQAPREEAPPVVVHLPEPGAQNVDTKPHGTGEQDANKTE